MAYEDYEAVIGLEIHAQFLTKSKMFCSCSTEFGKGDNENTCPTCTGMPGALPVLNDRAVEFAIRTGLALNCEINLDSVFARKNYFYPDLPKGYQISQFDLPICGKGHVDFFVGEEKKRVNITRAHLEEDAGKSTHSGDFTTINLNRSSVPLLEIVSEPDIRSAKEAASYAKSIRSILLYTEVCDGNLEEGSMRCDCNISVRKKGEINLGTKVELKNINSFRFIEKAIEYEIDRQIDCVETGEPIVQETRLYDSTKNKTYSMRSKEEAHDYRYFPEPDLLVLNVEESRIEKIKGSLPELPLARAERFQSEYGLPKYDSFVLTQSRQMADYFETVAKESGNPKVGSNWIMVELMAKLNEDKKEIQDSKITPRMLSAMIKMIDNDTISGKIAKTVFAEMYETGKEPDVIVKEKNLVQITDDSMIRGIIVDVIAANPNQLAQLKSGKDKLFGFFVGQAMKATKGQANPKMVNDILKEELAKA